MGKFYNPGRATETEKLLPLVNRLVLDLARIFNKNLTITENFDGALLTTQVTGTYPLDLRWDRLNPPKAAWIGACRESSGPHTNLASALTLDWEFTNGLFRINTIAGLSASTSTPYNITIVAITG